MFSLRLEIVARITGNNKLLRNRLLFRVIRQGWSIHSHEMSNKLILSYRVLNNDLKVS